MAAWIWTLCYAVDMKLLLGERPGRPSWYHSVAWICPGVLTIFGLSILYLPDANCHEATTLSTAVLRILPNYCATYVLLALVMIVNPVLYVKSTRDLENAVTCSLAQMTSRERKLVKTIKLKFALINIVYYICWLPNLINGILLWSLWLKLPVKIIITLWYIMAVTNPLQAFFNAIVYQRWGRREKLSVLWKKLLPCASGDQSKDNFNELNEVSPLVTSPYGFTPHTSINGSSSL
uniref:GPR143 protein n=1 Tax=Fopius arisanus TaxID=64838 RepID=A0A0C9RMN2_9HYME